MTYPVTSTIYGTNWTGTITGTATTNSGSAVASASVAIEDTGTTRWWNGTSFSARQPDLHERDLRDRELDVDLRGEQARNGTRLPVWWARPLTARGTVGTSSPATAFTYNTSAPTVAVTYPVTSTIYGTNWAGTITGTSSTNSGSAVASASVALEDVTAGKSSNGTSFTPTVQTFVPVTSGTTQLVADLRCRQPDLRAQLQRRRPGH